tara:strand:- start:22 stop:312 length:291 start_codon:yes stop_codon:yes gene_type:complete
MSVTYTNISTRPNTDVAWFNSGNIPSDVQSDIDAYKSAGKIISLTTTGADTTKVKLVSVFNNETSAKEFWAEANIRDFRNQRDTYNAANGITRAAE